MQNSGDNLALSSPSDVQRPFTQQLQPHEHTRKGSPHEHAARNETATLTLSANPKQNTQLRNLSPHERVTAVRIKSRTATHLMRSHTTVTTDAYNQTQDKPVSRI